MALAVASFIIVHTIIQFNNRVNNGDDFLMLDRLEEHGVFRSIQTWEYNQRPVSHFFFNVTFIFNERLESLRWTLLFAHTIFIALYAHSFHILLRGGSRRLGIGITGWRTWVLSMMLVMSVFFFVFERVEVWFWYIAFVVYLLPFLFLNYGLYYLFKEDRRKWLSMLFFFLIGGTLELMIPMTACLLLVLYLNHCFPFRVMMANVLSLGALSIFQLFNGGVANRMRHESFHRDHHTGGLQDIFMHLVDNKMIFFALLLIMFLSALWPYRRELRGLASGRVIISYGVLLTAFILITGAVSAFVFSGSLGFARMWAPFSIFLMGFIIILGIWVVVRIKMFPVIIGIGSAVIFIGLLVVFGVEQKRITGAYAALYDGIIAGLVEPDDAPVGSGVLASPGSMRDLESHLKAGRYGR